MFIKYDTTNKKKIGPKDLVYSLHLYFIGLSLRNTFKAISRFVMRNHSTIRLDSKYKPKRLSYTDQDI